MKILSLGWGVQSFTLAAMVALGELDPIDCALHSDTGFESKLTYEFAKKWTPWLLERGVNVVTVKGTDGDLRQIFWETKKGNKFLQIPAFQQNNNGSFSIGRRQCTKQWKLVPMRRWIAANRHGDAVEQWIGISLDERERMRLADVKYLTNRWPLIELRMTKASCIAWLESKELEVPPKSACVFCPYHGTAEWRMTKSVRDDWKLVLEVEQMIAPDNFLNAKGLSMGDLDLSTPEENGQMNFFDCSGTCWS